MKNVNLARREDFATVTQAQENPVTAAPGLLLVLQPINERDNNGPLLDLFAAPRAARAHDGLHRRRTGGFRTLYRRHGRRHAARRESAAADAGDAEERLGGSGGR